MRHSNDISKMELTSGVSDGKYWHRFLHSRGDQRRTTSWTMAYMLEFNLSVYHKRCISDMISVPEMKGDATLYEACLAFIQLYIPIYMI